jgi:hypothetical protein
MKHTKPQRITLAEFVREFGAAKLAALCKVDRTMPYKWAKGESAPNLDHAETILTAAKGRLQLADLKKGGAR